MSQRLFCFITCNASRVVVLYFIAGGQQQQQLWCYCVQSWLVIPDEQQTLLPFPSMLLLWNNSGSNYARDGWPYLAHQFHQMLIEYRRFVYTWCDNFRVCNEHEKCVTFLVVVLCGGGSQTKPVADTSLIPAILTTKLIVESYCSTTVTKPTVQLDVLSIPPGG